MSMRSVTLLALASAVGLGARDARAQSSSADSIARIPGVSARILIRRGDTTGRPMAIEHSDFYYTRLTVHRIGSYAMLPMFAAEYWLGDQLLNKGDPPQWVRPTHGAVATGVGVLFTVNTATGVWNLWDSRHDSDARLRKYLHAGLMVASDAGFLWTAQTAKPARQSLTNARHHRDIALRSIGLSTIGTAMMWLWN